jgi:hypothetical protein
VNDVLERMWQDVASFKVLSKCLPGMTKKHNKNRESRYPSSGSRF